MKLQMDKTITLLIALVATTFSSHADPLVSIDETGGSGGPGFATSTSFQFTSISNPPGLFGNYQYTVADVGKTFVANQANDPNFDTMVSVLTNGKSDQIGFFSGGGGTFGPESLILVPLPPGSNGIDLQGFHIDNIDLRINQLIFASPGSDLNHDGNWTDITFDVTILINSSPVPEPAAGTLVGLALGSGWLLRRRQSRSNDIGCGRQS